MRRRYAIILVLLLAISSAGAQPDGRPPLQVGRIAAEIAVGWIGGSAGLLVATAVSPSDGAATAASAVVWPVATAAAVYLVGTAGGETGSFRSTLAGSALGALTVIAAYGAVGLAGGGETALWYVMIPGVFFPVAGATIEFNRTRGYDDASGGSLLNIDRNGAVAFGAPAVSLRASRIDGTMRRETAVVRARF